MNATFTKPVEITFREEYEGGIVYYTVKSQSYNKEYYVRLTNGVFDGCTCPTKRSIECKHGTACVEHEKERSSDLKQHLQDEKHSCIYCGRPMTYDGVCGGCQ